MFWMSFLSTLLLDQLSKLLIFQTDLAVVNSGIAFSMLDNLAEKQLLVVIVMVALIMVWLFRHQWQKLPLASGLFWGGMMANLLDRILFGQVIDWLLIPILNLKNNLADVAIWLGLIIVLMQEMKNVKN